MKIKKIFFIESVNSVSKKEMAFLEAEAFRERFLGESGVKIGEGTYGLVMKHKNVAVKYIDPDNHCSAIREINFYSLMNHPNIIELLGWSLMGDMTLAFPCGISVIDAIKEGKTTLFDVARDLLSALTYLNTNGIAHCDIKPGNLVWLEACDRFPARTVLIDLGIAKFAAYGTHDSTTPIHEITNKEYFIDGVSYADAYRDPEYFPKIYNSIRCELYAYGVTICDIEATICNKGAFDHIYHFEGMDNPVLEKLVRKCFEPLSSRSDIWNIARDIFGATDTPAALRDQVQSIPPLDDSLMYLTKQLYIIDSRYAAMAVDLLRRSLYFDPSLNPQTAVDAIKEIATSLYTNNSDYGDFQSVIHLLKINNGILLRQTIWDSCVYFKNTRALVDVIAQDKFEAWIENTHLRAVDKLKLSHISNSNILLKANSKHPTLLQIMNKTQINEIMADLAVSVKKNNNLTSGDLPTLKGIHRKIITLVQHDQKKLEFTDDIKTVYKTVTCYRNSQPHILGQKYTLNSVIDELFEVKTSHEYKANGYVPWEIFETMYMAHDSEEVGKGTYGVVKGYNDVAVKIFKADDIDSMLISALTEINFYSTLTHPNIIKLLGWSFSDDNRMFLAFPRGIRVVQAIQEGKTTLRQVAIDVLNGIIFMNKHGIAHGDIKDTNLVWLEASDSFPARTALIDFGITCLCIYGDRGGVNDFFIEDTQYTPGYRDPEYFDWNFNSIKCELYAYAIAIYNIHQLANGLDPNYTYDTFYSTDDSVIDQLLQKCTTPLTQRERIEDIFKWLVGETGISPVSGDERIFDALDERVPPFTAKCVKEYNLEHMLTTIDDKDRSAVKHKALAVCLARRSVNSHKGIFEWTERHSKALPLIIPGLTYISKSIGEYIKEILDITIANKGILLQRTHWDRGANVPNFYVKLMNSLIFEPLDTVPSYLTSSGEIIPFNKLSWVTSLDVDQGEVMVNKTRYAIKDVPLFPTLIEPMCHSYIIDYIKNMKTVKDEKLHTEERALFQGVHRKILETIVLTGKKFTPEVSLTLLYSIMCGGDNETYKDMVKMVVGLL